MEKINLNKNDLKIHNFVITYTTPLDYEMRRFMLLEDIKGLEYGEYVICEGYHCSCYGFDDTEWEYFKYKENEIKDLIKIKIDDKYCDKHEKEFYKMCKEYFEGEYW